MDYLPPLLVLPVVYILFLTPILVLFLVCHLINLIFENLLFKIFQIFFPDDYKERCNATLKNIGDFLVMSIGCGFFPIAAIFVLTDSEYIGQGRSVRLWEKIGAVFAVIFWISFLYSLFI